MANRPILFSAPMILALLAGRKTQTRRIVKPPPEPWKDFFEEGGCQTTDWRFETGMRTDDGIHHRFGLWMHSQFHESRWQSLRFAPGDRLWVREAWQMPIVATKYGPVYYAADQHFFMNQPFALRTNRSPIHMPRWASRITLTVTDVRVQRLQEISQDDAIAEGIEFRPDSGWATWNSDGSMRCGGSPMPIDAYRCLWTNINGTGAWDENPWVAAYTFTVERHNIDKVEA